MKRSKQKKLIKAQLNQNLTFEEKSKFNKAKKIKPTIDVEAGDLIYYNKYPLHLSMNKTKTFKEILAIIISTDEIKTTGMISVMPVGETNVISVSALRCRKK